MQANTRIAGRRGLVPFLNKGILRPSQPAAGTVELGGGGGLVYLASLVPPAPYLPAGERVKQRASLKSASRVLTGSFRTLR